MEIFNNYVTLKLPSRDFIVNPYYVGCSPCLIPVGKRRIRFPVVNRGNVSTQYMKYLCSFF